LKARNTAAGYSDFCRWHRKEAESWAKGRNPSLLVKPSYDAAAMVNEIVEQRKKVAALIHITC